MDELSMALIAPDPNNVRKMGDKDIARLAENMRFVGLVQPIVVRRLPVDGTPDNAAAQYMVVDGHRRFAAAQSLGWTEIEAVVRAGEHNTLAQLSANVMSVDMEPLDLFEAVARLHAEGMETPAIAIALGQTERRVQQMRAMGSLHPALVAYIRQTGDMPGDGNLATICQATHEQQAAAWGKGNVAWWQMAERLSKTGYDVRYMPAEVVASYTGPRFSDLFIDETLLLDMKVVDELMAEHIADLHQKAQKAGFKLAECKVSDYGEIKTPPGCLDYSRRELDWKMKKAERSAWAAAFVWHSGRFRQIMFHIKEKRVVEKNSAALAAPLTGKGVAMIESAKREYAGAFFPTTNASDAGLLMVVMAYLLKERLSPAHYGEALCPSGTALIAPDGTLPQADTPAVIAWVQQLIEFAVNDKRIGLPLVQRIGATVGAAAMIEATADNLAMVKKPGLEAIRQASGLGEAKTQRALREAISQRLIQIGAAELPQLAWDIAAPQAIEDEQPEDEGEDEDYEDAA